ncbi:TetR/AcrR family transcriptional regulator [Rhodovulum marinum]|uniref:TetR family transcriptional regulator n=1 Tax=Rhodovulum marinum TaxID=320662 RepID=A0A4R2PVM1_9RHOB|nr:TetR/AcrR family transcriptional regulator [Rhodovulum marinum]TCP39999.1 TetR family transcriptional regulator [Rhodovulum marinum]
MNELAPARPKAEHCERWSIAAAPADTARGRIMAAAAHLFCHHGFAATGVDAVVARAGTAKATLYKHFPSKDELIAAVLEAEGAAWRTWFFGRLRAVQGPPQARLLAVFDILGEWFADDQFYGCPFINAIAEFDTGDSAIRETAMRHKTHLVTWLTAHAIEMGAPDPKAVARALVVLIDGAIVAAQGARDPGFAAEAKALARTYLDSLTIPA